MQHAANQAASQPASQPGSQPRKLFDSHKNRGNETKFKRFAAPRESFGIGFWTSPCFSLGLVPFPSSWDRNLEDASWHGCKDNRPRFSCNFQRERICTACSSYPMSLFRHHRLRLSAGRCETGLGFVRGFWLSPLPSAPWPGVISLSLTETHLDNQHNYSTYPY